MGVYEIQGPDGKVYEVEADSIEQAAQAFSDPGPSEPPEGMVMNPYTGQMTSRELLANTMDPSRAGSAAAGAYRGMSFATGDELQGALNAITPGPGTMGERYAYGREYQRAVEDAARRDAGGAFTAGEIGGALATALTPVGVGGRAAQAAGRIPGAARAGQFAARHPLGTRMATSAAQGAGLAGAYGYGAGEGGAGERAKSARAAAMLGAGVGAAVPAAGGAIQKGMQARATRKAIKEAAKAGKTTDELFDTGRDLYRQVSEAGVEVKPESAIRGYGEAAVGLGEQGAARTYTGGVQHPMPASAAMFQMAKQQAEAAATKPRIPFRDIDLDSQVFRNTAGSNIRNPSDTRIAKEGAGKFEDWLLSLGPDDVAAGDVETMTRVLPEAREIWRLAKKSDVIDEAVEAGQDYLSGGASGIKNRFKSILRNPKTSKQYSEGEKAAMRRVIDGTVPEKFIDMFGSGLGQMATTAAGGATGSGFGVLGTLGGIGAGAAVGQGARRASEALARRNAEIARAAIASGKLQGLPVVDPQRRAIIEALMRGTATPMLAR